jgi:16S rRNA (guanine527-N7)-methyltransferase
VRDALARAAGRDVSRETFELIECYVALLREEAGRQNLMARSTLESLWERHIVDSAQLVRFEPCPGASWVDVGSGAGLPGIVIATLVEGPVALVEAVAALSFGPRVAVIQSKIERVTGRFDVITGRAVAPVTTFIDFSHHLSTKKTLWVLPRGRSAQSELAEARRSWHCTARVEPSCTDPDSQILVLAEVGAKKR